MDPDFSGTEGRVMDSGGLLDRLTVTDDVHRQRLMMLISTCEEMLLLAGRGEWTRVAELEARRASELEDYFSMPCARENVRAVGEVIAMLIEMNDKLVDIVSRARDEKGLESRKFRQGLKAVEQYRSV